MRIIDPDTFRSAASHRAAVKRAEEIAALQYRIEQLEAQLAKAREGAMAAAAKICADVDIALITDSDYYYRGFDDCKRKTQEAIDAAIAAAKEK